MVKCTIEGYPKGSDITILNTSYIREKKDDDDGSSAYVDYLFILFKDNKTGEKHYCIKNSPSYTYYMVKNGGKLKHHFMFIEEDELEPYTCPYSKLLYDIATKNNFKEWFYNNIRMNNFAGNRQLHTLNHVFYSDIDIEDYYRALFAERYTNEPCKLNKAYLDIEVDGRNRMGEFPESGECPINAISFLNDENNTSYQFILEDKTAPNYNMIQEYKKYINSQNGINELKQFITNTVGGYKKANKYEIDKLQYKFLFYEDEAAMIYDLFQLMRELSPDILLIWNMAFDLSYIRDRIDKLGYNPLDFICDDSIPVKFFRFYVDERNKNEFAERGDFVSVSSYTVWLDQMIQFASRRKGRGQYVSFKLDDIGKEIAGVRKLDYSNITTDIMQLPYLNFKIFSWYNVMDTIVQKCIEAKTQDVEYVTTKSLINNTRLSKAHRQSVYLANRFRKEFKQKGFIMGNNVNIWNEKPTEKYPGAMVGDPTHNSGEPMIKLPTGQSIFVADNVIDYDYKSLYPSITIENNMAPNTQRGKLYIDEQVHDKEHWDMYTSDEETAKYSRAGEMLENMMSGNHIEFCHRWLHLGNIKEVLDDMIELYSAISIKPNVGVKILPFKNVHGIEPMLEYDGMIKGVTFDTEYSDKDKLLSEVRKKAFI